MGVREPASAPPLPGLRFVEDVSDEEEDDVADPKDCGSDLDREE